MPSQEWRVMLGEQELNAQDALAWIAAQEEYPDLILLDCMMPGMSGHEFCRELRKTVPQSLVPVIMISAKNNEDTIVTGLQQGCNDFIRHVYWHGLHDCDLVAPAVLDGKQSKQAWLPSSTCLFLPEVGCSLACVQFWKLFPNAIMSVGSVCHCCIHDMMGYASATR